MFDVSFSEMMVIAIVALIVIGPEKLPKVARTIGALVGRMQRYVATVKEEVNRETRFAELQELQQEIKRGVESARATIIQSTRSVELEAEQHVQAITQSTNSDVDGINIDNKILAEKASDKLSTPDLFETPAIVSSNDLQPVKKPKVRKPRTAKSSAKKLTETDDITAPEEKLQSLEASTVQAPTI